MYVLLNSDWSHWDHTRQPKVTHHCTVPNLVRRFFQYFSNQISLKRRAIFLWGSTVNWARAADVARLRAATKLTQGPILDEDEDVNEIEDEDEDEDEDKNENEVPGGSAWNQKPRLGASLIWMDSRIRQSTERGVWLWQIEWQSFTQMVSINILRSITFTIWIEITLWKMRGILT